MNWFHGRGNAWLTGTLDLSRGIVNVISNTCAFLTNTNQNVCCEKDLLRIVMVLQERFNTKYKLKRILALSLIGTCPLTPT